MWPGGKAALPTWRKLRRGPLGPLSVLLPLDSPFSTCVFPQGAWKWLLSVSLFHSGTKSFSAVDDLFWTSFFFWSACFVRVGLPWAPHERCFIPWLILRNRASHVGRAVLRHRWRQRGLEWGRQEVGSGSPPGPAVGTRPSFEIRRRRPQSCFESHPPRALDLVNTPHRCFPFPGLRSGGL